MIYDTLLQIEDVPVAYSHFRTPQDPPYIVYIGAGQDTFNADDTLFFKRNRYQVEYYYTTKNESIEDEIETVLTEGGFLYEKSEDVFIESEDVFVIYYYVFYGKD